MLLYHGTNRTITSLDRSWFSYPEAAHLFERREDAERCACDRVRFREEGSPYVYTFNEMSPVVEKIDSGWVLKAASIKPIREGELVDCAKLSPEIQ